MEEFNHNRKPTKQQTLGIVIGAGLFFVPITLLGFFPNNSIVSVLLGEGRILYLWIIVGAFIFAFREKIDAVVDRKSDRNSLRN